MTLHVVVAGWLDDGRPSGASRRLRELVRAVQPRLGPDERVTVATAAIPAGPPWRRARRERAVLPGLLRELGATVVELGALPVPRGLPCPVSLVVHDVRDLDGWRRRRVPNALLRHAMRRSFARCASLVVPSEFTAERLRAHFDDLPPIHVVPNGVRTVTDMAAERAGGPPYVLHVGHLEPRKNLGVLIEALAGLPEPISLRLVGADHGEGIRLVRHAVARGVDARVVFEGVVDDARLAALYAGAHAVAVPSRYEGFGLSALEGLAYGRPVVVADSGALPEVVGSAGTIVPADDASAWARALASVALDPEGARARAAELSWDRAADAALAVWRGIA